MKSYLIVFLGGGVGAALRYWLSGAVYRYLPADFPYGTLAVNISGCFLIGILMAFQDGRFDFQPTFRLLIGIGILGGFTTFSTFSYETTALLRDGQVIQASLNIFVSLLGCLAATFAGMTMGKLL
ncbi:MAG: fluoride efflux transporter CrcB [Bacteroidota bacterium]